MSCGAGTADFMLARETMAGALLETATELVDGPLALADPLRHLRGRSGVFADKLRADMDLKLGCPVERAHVAHSEKHYLS